MKRIKLPDRRATWRQKVRIGGTALYLDCGEYANGTLGEVFVNASKEGTLVRGLLDALARMTSVALQHEVPASEVAKALKGLRFPPQGAVSGSAAVQECSSLPDWIGQEIEAAYCEGAKDAEAK